MMHFSIFTAVLILVVFVVAILQNLQRKYIALRPDYRWVIPLLIVYGLGLICMLPFTTVQITASGFDSDQVSDGMVAFVNKTDQPLVLDCKTEGGSCSDMTWCKLSSSWLADWFPRAPYFITCEQTEQMNIGAHQQVMLDCSSSGVTYSITVEGQETALELTCPESSSGGP